tara:strand:- start:2475 stop:2663 length:189 start_codon:yes stop_codon:yes gene_type:complete
MIKDEIVVFPAEEYGAIRLAAGKKGVFVDTGFIAIHSGVTAHGITTEEAVEKCYNKASQNAF